MIKGNCRLCGMVAELQESHIVPGFVYKWLKDSSGTGYIRFGQQPNKRSQDGLKSHWLCAGCEERLNKWETQFANQIFHPLNQDGKVHIRYGSWFLPFCVSVSWRVLNFYIDDGIQLPDKFRKSVDRAEAVWKDFILGRKPHPEKHEQHFLPLDAIESHTIPDMPPNMNRYILRTVDIDTIHSEQSAFIYSKLGRFIIVGFIEEPDPRQWKGTKVHVNKGIVKPQQYTIPGQFEKYLQGKASRMTKSHSQISKKQRKKIDETLMKDPDRVANSESFNAMSHDVKLFGDAAFRKDD